MDALTEEQIGFICEDSLDEIEEFDEIYEGVLNEFQYTTASSVISEHCQESILMSMISFRVDNNIKKAKFYLSNARIAITKFQSLRELIEQLMVDEKLDVTVEPNCLLPVFLEYPLYLALLNKNLEDIQLLHNIYISNVTAKKRGFPFSQQFSPLILMGCLDQQEEFTEMYKEFMTIKSIPKDAFEQWLVLYIDMLAAIVERDQDKFDQLHLKAEAAMQSHATDKKWGEDFMSGGLEDNALVYDYQGTAMCCLATLRGMQVNHFSKYYPKEIILG